MSEKKIINVAIKDKIAVADENALYVCGNSDFVVHFDFDEEWAAHETKTARFIKNENRSFVDVVFDGNECPVPVLSNTYNILVGVFAGNLSTTTPALIHAKKSILCEEGNPIPPSNDIYHEIMERMAKLGIAGVERLEAELAELEEQFDELAEKATQELSQQIDDLEHRLDEHINPYVNIAVTPNGLGTYERGVVIDSVNVKWSVNRNPQSLTISGPGIDGTEELSVTDRNYTAPTNSEEKLGITWENTSNFKWTIKAVGEREEVSTKQTAPITFLNGVYWGAAAQPEVIDSAFVLGLTKKLTSGKVTSITVNAGAGQYIWYCLPVRSPFGTCKFTVGGFEGGFALATDDPIDFKNASGYTESYYVYRSDESNLGNTTVGVS